MPETILTEQRGDVLLITLNRPEKLNAWSTRMGRELSQTIRDANASAEVGAMVVTGAGRAFCAGADIGDTFADREATAAASEPGTTGAGAERAPRAGDDDGADGGVGVGVADRLLELPAHARRPRVELLRPVEHQLGDLSLALEPYERLAGTVHLRPGVDV